MIKDTHYKIYIPCAFIRPRKSIKIPKMSKPFLLPIIKTDTTDMQNTLQSMHGNPKPQRSGRSLAETQQKHHHWDQNTKQVVDHVPYHNWLRVVTGLTVSSNSAGAMKWLLLFFGHWRGCAGSINDALEDVWMYL